MVSMKIFCDLEMYVAKKLYYDTDIIEAANVREFMMNRLLRK